MPAGFVLFNDETWSYKVLSNDALVNNFDFYDVKYDNSPIRIYYDGGNPGDAFDSILIAPGTSVLYASRKGNITVDNLCIKYTGWHGIQTSNVHDIKITNCEIGWIGGAGDKVRWGNGVEFWGTAKNCVVDHNYVYQVYDTGLTNQYAGVYDTVCVEENITYSKNLVDYCTYSFEFFTNQKNSNNDIMKNIYIVDNISRYTGYGWGEHNRPDKEKSCHVKGWGSKNRCDNIVIADNIFYDAKYGTIH